MAPLMNGTPGMRYLASAVFALLFVFPAFAQNRAFDLTGNVVWFDSSGGGEFEDLADPTTIEFEGTRGYGLAANVFFGNRISTEFAIARIDAEATTRRRAVTSPGGNIDIMPVTAVLQFHFAPNAVIDPYVGAGVAYVLFDDVDANGVNNIDRIDFDDDYGVAVNAGLGIRLGNNFGLTVDGKYIPLESSARAVFVGGGESEAQFDMNPIILSAGLSLRF